MSYRFIFSQADSGRIVPAVLIDSRATISEIKNQIGSVIKTFTDAQSAMVTDATLFYKIESDTGNVAGYFTLKIVRQGVVSILQQELRPAFKQFSVEISQQIANFINTNGYVQDYLQ